MFENLNIKPLVRNANRLESFVHTNKLGTDQYLVLTKAQHENDIRLQLEVNGLLVLASFPYWQLMMFDEDTVINSIKSVLVTKYISTCIKEFENLKAGIDGLMLHEPNHPFVMVFNSINRGDLVDSNDENVQYILRDLINEVFA